MTDQRIQQDAICYQWFKQRLMLNVSKPSISQQSQIKEDTVEPSVLSQDINKYNLHAPTNPRRPELNCRPLGPGGQTLTGHAHLPLRHEGK